MKPVSRWSRVKQGLLGWVYPPVCAACDTPLDSKRQLARPFLCADCEATLPRIGEHYCQVCGEGFAGLSLLSFRCANCSDHELAFDFAVSCYRGAGVGSLLIHRLKYGKQRHLARLLGTLLDEVWRDRRLREGGPWWVVPVPLHSRRRRARGFNQSHELAHELVARAPEGVSLELHPLLRRIRQGVNQARLDRRERLVNLTGAYALSRCRLRSVPDEVGILLIDDVITTGATASECASVLRRELGVRRIAAVSVLRG